MVGGQTLHFLYAASNNQNFVMRDAETGTWWQQVTGEAILGSGKGKRLEPFAWDEVNFGIFKREHPDGLVLRPDDTAMARYPFARYRLPEKEQIRGRPMPSWYRPDPDVALEPRDMVISVQVGEGVKAYPLQWLVEQNPIQDSLGDMPLLVVVAADGKSAHAFDRSVDGKILELYVLSGTETGAEAEDSGSHGISRAGNATAAGAPGPRGSESPAAPASATLVLVDAQTGSHWDYSGTAIDGPLAGHHLRRIQTVRDYWFDWRRYHPDGPVYLAGH